jgi:GNAT superfamily N-acetyltransferase
MLKVAETSDRDLIFDLVDLRIEELYQDFINADRQQKIILLNEDKGLMVAMCFQLGALKLATDVLWYVKPEHRHNSVGSELLEALEDWAKRVGCTHVSITSLDPTQGKEYFEERGYTFQGGMSYMKEI